MRAATRYKLYGEDEYQDAIFPRLNRYSRSDPHLDEPGAGPARSPAHASRQHLPSVAEARYLRDGRAYLAPAVDRRGA